MSALTIIEVTGGVATATFATDDTHALIIDWDEMKENPSYATEVLEAVAGAFEREHGKADQQSLMQWHDHFSARMKDLYPMREYQVTTTIFVTAHNEDEARNIAGQTLYPVTGAGYVGYEILDEIVPSER